MGQNAVESEPLETQLYIVDHDKFFRSFGIEPGEYELLPSMLPQFNYEVKAGKSAEFKQKLDSMTINGIPAKYRDLGSDRFSLDFGQQNLKSVEIKIDDQIVVFDQSGLKNVEIEDKSNATAYHIPEGHLFVYHPSFGTSEMSEHQVPTCELVPTFLKNFNVEIPDYAVAPSEHLLS